MALKVLEIENYHIEEIWSESVECFFVKKHLDLKRRTEVTEYSVTVYRDFVKNETSMRGSSAVQIYPGMEQEEILKELAGAYYAASLVCNPYYELISGQKAEMIASKSQFAKMSLDENMKLITEALFAADTEEEVFLNSSEVFLRHKKHHILNSKGVDVGYEVHDVWGEYVVQCVTPQDVETYHQFSYRDMETEALRKEVEEAIRTTRARAQAFNAPKAGEYALILSENHVRTLLTYYLSRSNTSLVYQKYSNYEVGTKVQGEDVQGDALTILLKAKDPYSIEGIPMRDRVLVENGELKVLHGGARFAYYLGIEPTGRYQSIAVPIGEIPLEELKREPYLHVISFSDFQMDDFTGYFGGEIRLAYLYDGETVTLVTGGSVNGNLLEVQGRLRFSKERYSSANYEGPLAVRMEGVKVAGEV